LSEAVFKESDSASPFCKTSEAGNYYHDDAGLLHPKELIYKTKSLIVSLFLKKQNKQDLFYKSNASSF
jgi:hypothetical protein